MNESDCPILVDINIQEEQISCELDCGAGKSVIPKSLYESKFRKLQLDETKVRLKQYAGKVLLVPEGYIEVDLQLGRFQTKGQMLVVKDGCRPLIGRDLLKKIGFQIVDVNSVDTTCPELQCLLDKFKSLFDRFF